MLSVDFQFIVLTMKSLSSTSYYLITIVLFLELVTCVIISLMFL